MIPLRALSLPKMNNAQRTTLVIGWLAIFVINLSDASPRMFKGWGHLVGPETVSVRVPGPDSSTMTVPVMRVADGFQETGQRVEVYVRNGYRADEIQHAPRLTIIVLVAFALSYAIAGRIGGKRRETLGTEHS
jgi:hypothetical protein